MPEGEPFHDVTLRAGAARAVVRERHARCLCDGHFPGDPMVPGAHLAGLMADLAARLVGGGEPAEVERCVFLAPVCPESGIVVEARTGGDGRVDAEILVNGGCAARATLRFGVGP